MKKNITPTNKKHLKAIIENEIFEGGINCDLNHIDISKITDLSDFFKWSQFNGDISKWDTSNVTNMDNLFYSSLFNGDISKWNVSKVTDMDYLFCNSKFTGDISSWQPLSVESNENMFWDCTAPIPSWLENNSKESLKISESHDLNNVNSKSKNNKIKN